jgi:hypothetical protein
MVKQEMELDSPLRLAEGGPIKESGTKVDDGGVKAEELVLEAELLSRGNGPALAKKLIKHFLIELPGPFLISIGQRGPGGGAVSMPRCFNFPRQVERPPQISRNERA